MALDTSKKYKLAKKALIKMGRLRKPPLTDPDPIPFTRVRFFNNSGERTWVQARGIDENGSVQVPWTPLNDGWNIDPGEYSGLDDGMHFAGAEDVVTVEFWVLFESQPFWEFHSDTAPEPMHGVCIDSFFPEDPYGEGTYINCFKHLT